MLNFYQFINESKEDDFNSLIEGDIVLRRGTRFKVKSVLKNKEGLIDTIKIAPVKRMDNSTHSSTLNLNQFKEQVSNVIKKENEDEK